ncbi:MAG: hypothetical protein Q8S84_02120 [bacterium]|nr:hypothetical protein [bacterium]MDP3380352.1 hypothetical protein [bacterium]
MTIFSLVRFGLITVDIVIFLIFINSGITFFNLLNNHFFHLDIS